MKPVIFLDMDEVLVDFVGGVCRVFGLTQEELEARWEPGVWDITQPLGVTADELWNSIDSTPFFWSKLKPLPWFENLVGVVGRYTSTWYIATAPSPSGSPDCYAQKGDWVQRYLGKEFADLILIRKKSLLAKPNTVLIDDREKSIIEFCEAGGDGILFPSYTNSLYQQRSGPLDSVEKTLYSLFREK